jgi:hypothetical protein
MQELVNAISSGFGLLDLLSMLPHSVSQFELAPEKVSIAAVLSGAGSVILGKFTGSVGYITMPVNYCALFIGSLVSNWIFQGIHIPLLDADLQTPMLLSVAGMTAAALAVLMFLKPEQT